MSSDIGELEFLSNAALALDAIGPDDDLFHEIATVLAQLAPDGLVAVSSYDDSTGVIAVRALLGPEDMLILAQDVTGEALGLQNAAKFTPAGGRASVSVQADEANGKAVLRVHNTDTRISPEVLGRRFEPFVQADRTLDRSKGGLGLGLALVKGIVELHHGTVDVDSDATRGTTLTIRLPLDAGLGQTARSEVPPETRPAGHRHVLVIEDNADAANSLREALELHANTVAVARTGAEGIAMLDVFKPDVVLCDIGLPGMNGYEVARTIRAHPEVKDVALVALSGYATPEDVERARQAGFDRHVSKPPSVEVLERLMSELVRR